MSRWLLLVALSTPLAACGGSSPAVEDAAVEDAPLDAAPAFTGPVHGQLTVEVAGRATHPRDVEVWLRAVGGAAGPHGTTDESGRFSLSGGLTPGGYQVCSRADGLPELCVAPIELAGDGEVVAAPPLTRIAPPGSAVVRVVRTDGSPCFDQFPTFDATVDGEATLTAAASARTARVNARGEAVAFAIAPAADLAVTVAATCGGAAATRDAVVGPAGAWLDATIANARPTVAGIVVRRADALGEQAAAGQVLTLSTDATDDDPLTYRWRVPTGAVEGTGATVTWTVPPDADLGRIYLLVDDGRGGLAQASAALEPAEPGFRGTVRDEAGAPLAGATIKIGAEQATTDAAGAWEIAAPTAPRLGTPTTITISAPDHVLRQWSLLEPNQELDASLLACETVMFAPDSAQTLIAPGIGDTLQVDVPAMAVVDAAGAPVTTPVAACLRVIDGAVDVPVSLAGAVAPVGQGGTASRVAVAVWLEVRDPVTQRPLKLRTAATVHVQAPTGSVIPADARPRVLHHDAGTGRWRAGATTTVTSDRFVGDSTGGLVSFGDELGAGCVTVWADRLRLPKDSHVVRVQFPGPYGAPTRTYFPLEPGLNVLRPLPPGPATFELVPATIPWGPAAWTTTATVPLSLSTTDVYDPRMNVKQCKTLVAFGAPMAPPPGGALLSRRRLTSTVDSTGGAWSAAQLAEAYYDTIDPTGAKTTLAAWMAANGWTEPAQPNPTRQLGDAWAVYFNDFDLGFGRFMRMKVTDRTTTDPIQRDVAMVVTNYHSLRPATEDARLLEVGFPQYHFGASVAMEWSPGPAGGHAFTKFYVFDRTGARIPEIDLDGAGLQAVPHLCLNCHGGDPPPAFQIADGVAASGRWPAGSNRPPGDVGARFVPFALDSFGYDIPWSPITPAGHYSRVRQEAQFRLLNQALLSTNLTATARRLIHGWYGSADPQADTLDPAATQNSAWRPTGAGTAGWDDHPALYQQVVRPFCRNCHVSLAATWGTWDEFQRYSGSIQLDVCAGQIMPHALRTWTSFWSRAPSPAVTLLDAMAGEAGWAGAACPTL